MCFVGLDCNQILLSRVSNGRVRTRAFFQEPIFCLAWRMSDFRLTGRIMGESRVLRWWHPLALSFRLSRRALVVVNGLRFRACSGGFLVDPWRLEIRFSGSSCPQQYRSYLELGLLRIFLICSLTRRRSSSVLAIIHCSFNL